MSLWFSSNWKGTITLDTCLALLVFQVGLKYPPQPNCATESTPSSKVIEAFIYLFICNHLQLVISSLILYGVLESVNILNTSGYFSCASIKFLNNSKLSFV